MNEKWHFNWKWFYLAFTYNIVQRIDLDPSDISK